MTEQFQRELEALKRRVSAMGWMVEEAVNKSISALVNRLPDLAKEVLVGDDKLNAEEVEIERICFELVCCQQPVAVDARFIVTAIKVNNDLERMGDLAVNIAERAAILSVREPLPIPLDFSKMAADVNGMVRDSLTSFVNLDRELATDVCRRDDEVDLMNAEMYIALQECMKAQPQTIERAVHLLSASRHLERIADLATNISEDVLFLIDGRIVRHSVEDYAAGTQRRGAP